MHSPHLYISEPGVVPARGEIAGVSFVGIRFALERDVAVGVAFHAEPHRPLGDIPKIEKHIAHLFHLRRVYGLVVEHEVVGRTSATHETDAEEIDGVVAAQRNETVEDDFHDV